MIHNTKYTLLTLLFVHGFNRCFNRYDQVPKILMNSLYKDIYLCGWPQAI